MPVKVFTQMRELNDGERVCLHNEPYLESAIAESVCDLVKDKLENGHYGDRPTGYLIQLQIDLHESIGNSQNESEVADAST